MPAPAEFKRLLDIVPRVSPTICINERTGRPWSKYDFAIEFREIVTLSGLPTELQFRDLRRTAVVRLAEAGCSEAEIVAIPVPPSPVPR